LEKRLVAEIGEERRAFIAFFRNGDVIPDAATARWILKIRPEAEQKPSSPAAPVETRIPAIQFRRADAHTIKAGQIATPRGDRPHSRARLQSRHNLQKQPGVSS
jgi:hypothetical protein